MLRLSSIILDGIWTPGNRTADDCSQLLAITVFLLSAQSPGRERQRVEQDIQIAQRTFRERLVNCGTTSPKTIAGSVRRNWAASRKCLLRLSTAQVGKTLGPIRPTTHPTHGSTLDELHLRARQLQQIAVFKRYRFYPDGYAVKHGFFGAVHLGHHKTL